MPKVTLLIVTVEAGTISPHHHGTAIIHGHVTWELCHHNYNVCRRALLTCHSNTAPMVLRPLRQTRDQPNDRYLRQLGLELGSMHSPR